MAKLKRGQSAKDAYNGLSEHQKNRVEEVKRLNASQDKRIREEKAHVRKAVAQAVKDGVPIAVLAGTLNVTYARVFQMRDEGDVLLGVKKPAKKVAG